MVLRSLTRAPYEPIEQSNLKFLSHKTAFLLAIYSAKRVSASHALSVSEECLRWKADNTGLSFWPNLSSEISAFQLDPALTHEKVGLLTLCVYPIGLLTLSLSLIQGRTSQVIW